MASIETPDETLPVTWRPREEILPNEWNPNTMSEEKREELIHSIKDNGWTQPIIVDPDSDEIIDGEQRWHAAGDARIRADEDLTPDGVDEGYIPIFYLDVDETQARVATMQHNVNGNTNAESLGELFADLDEEGLFFEVSERVQLGETGIDRLIERAESEDDTPEAFLDDDEDEDDEDENEVFEEAVEFQMTREEFVLVTDLLTDADCELMDLFEWAVENNVHSQIRVDMRSLSDRDNVYQEGEDPIEYPSVDVERQLRSFYADDDPSEVTDDD